MQTFDQYNPQQVSHEQELLKFYKSPQKENGSDYYFVKQDRHLLIYTERLHIYPLTSDFKPGQTELVSGQFEMPLVAIRWFINVIEQKFFKSPEEGGLPANKISYEDIIAGEELHVMRSANAGCPHPG